MIAIADYFVFGGVEGEVEVIDVVDAKSGALRRHC